METLRQFYRLGFVEYPLFALFAAQIILGVALILKRGKPKGSWAWVQVILGGYIALFLLQHLGAIVMARINYDFETTTYFAAGLVSGLSVVTALSYGVADELPKPYQEYLAKSFGD